MADSARLQDEATINLRPVILGACFLWGILVGFSVNFFRSQESASTSSPTQSIFTIPAVPSPPPSAPENTDGARRDEGIPPIAAIENPPRENPVAETPPKFDQMEIGPPAVILSTETGLAGRTAAAMEAARPPPQAPIPARPAEPMIVDLDLP